MNQHFVWLGASAALTIRLLRDQLSLGPNLLADLLGTVRGDYAALSQWVLIVQYTDCDLLSKSTCLLLGSAT